MNKLVIATLIVNVVIIFIFIFIDSHDIVKGIVAAAIGLFNFYIIYILSKNPIKGGNSLSAAHSKYNVWDLLKKYMNHKNVNVSLMDEDNNNEEYDNSENVFDKVELYWKERYPYYYEMPRISKEQHQPQQNIFQKLTTRIATTVKEGFNLDKINKYLNFNFKDKMKKHDRLLNTINNINADSELSNDDKGILIHLAISLSYRHDPDKVKVSSDKELTDDEIINTAKHAAQKRRRIFHQHVSKLSKLETNDKYNKTANYRAMFELENYNWNNDEIVITLSSLHEFSEDDKNFMITKFMVPRYVPDYNVYKCKATILETLFNDCRNRFIILGDKGEDLIKLRQLYLFINFLESYNPLPQRYSEFLSEGDKTLIQVLRNIARGEDLNKLNDVGVSDLSGFTKLKLFKTLKFIQGFFGDRHHPTRLVKSISFFQHLYDQLKSFNDVLTVNIPDLDLKNKFAYVNTLSPKEVLKLQPFENENVKMLNDAIFMNRPFNISDPFVSYITSTKSQVRITPFEIFEDKLSIYDERLLSASMIQLLKIIQPPPVNVVSTTPTNINLPNVSANVRQMHKDLASFNFTRL